MKHSKEAEIKKEETLKVEIRKWASHRKRLKIFDIERLEWLENHTVRKPISPFSLVKEFFPSPAQKDYKKYATKSAVQIHS